MCRRHIVTEAAGLLVCLQVRSAGIRDSDGAPEGLEKAAKRCSCLRHIFAGGGFAGSKPQENSIAWNAGPSKSPHAPVQRRAFEGLPSRRVSARPLTLASQSLAGLSVMAPARSRGPCKAIIEQWRQRRIVSKNRIEEIVIGDGLLEFYRRDDAIGVVVPARDGKVHILLSEEAAYDCVPLLDGSV